MSCRDQNARSSASDSLNVEIALHATTRMHRQPSVRARALLLPPSSCRLIPVTNSDSRTREVDRGVGDVVGDAEPREVHAFEPGAPVGRQMSASRRSLSTYPGLIVLQRMPCAASSTAIARVSPFRPALAATYAASPALAALGLARRDVDDRPVPRGAHVRDRGAVDTTSAR